MQSQISFDPSSHCCPAIINIKMLNAVPLITQSPCAYNSEPRMVDYPLHPHSELKSIIFFRLMIELMTAQHENERRFQRTKRHRLYFLQLTKSKVHDILDHIIVATLTVTVIVAAIVIQ